MNVIRIVRQQDERPRRVASAQDGAQICAVIASIDIASGRTIAHQFPGRKPVRRPIVDAAHIQRGRLARRQRPPPIVQHAHAELAQRRKQQPRIAVVVVVIARHEKDAVFGALGEATQRLQRGADLRDRAVGEIASDDHRVGADWGRIGGAT